MIDGTVARKTKCASEFGARLDTVSGFVFMTVALGFVRMKKFISPHTVLNKATGLLLFLLPVTIRFIELTYTLPFVCAIATVAAIHELYDTHSEKKHDT